MVWIKICQGNFFNKRLDKASVVTLFLFRSANNRLKEKFVRELKPGTRIVSYVWTIDGWELQDCLPEDRIYLYVMKKVNDDRMEQKDSIKGTGN